MANVGHGKIIDRSYFSGWNFRFFPKFSYLNNVALGYFCPRVVSSLKPRTLRPAVFLFHILQIILLRPYKQMIGIAAGRIVAFMTNIHAFWNWSSKQFPSKPMSSRGHSLPFAGDSDFPISVKITMAFPYPTCVRFFYSAHKTLKNWFGFWGHSKIFTTASLNSQPIIAG